MNNLSDKYEVKEIVSDWTVRKRIEVLDTFRFQKHKLYYLKLLYKNKNIEGIYTCQGISDEMNTVCLKTIFEITLGIPDMIILNSTNMNDIVMIKEVEVLVSLPDYDKVKFVG